MIREGRNLCEGNRRMSESGWRVSEGAVPRCSGIEVSGSDGGSCPGTLDFTEPYWRVIGEGAIGAKEITECLKTVGAEGQP